MNRIMDALKAHPSLIAGLLGAALVAGVAIALSTLPLVPEGGGAGSAGSSLAVAGSAAGSAKASSPAPDEAEPDGADDPAEAGDDRAADAEADDEEAPDRGSDPGKGGEATGKPSKPGKPSSGGSAGGATQKPAAGGGQAQKPSSGGSQAQKPSKPKPSHTHSWSAVYRTEPVYSQQWVSKLEDVYKGIQERWICTACKAVFYSGGAIDSHIWDTYGDPQHPNGASAIDDSYEIWEKEDHGSYQNVQTGTQQVLDHYECSCGARK